MARYRLKIISFDHDLAFQFCPERDSTIHAGIDITPDREAVVSHPVGVVANFSIRNDNTAFSLSLEDPIPEDQYVEVDLWVLTDQDCIVMFCRPASNKQVFMWIGRQQFGFGPHVPNIVNVPLGRAEQVLEWPDEPLRRENFTLLTNHQTSVVVISESPGYWSAWFADRPQTSFVGDSPGFAVDRLRESEHGSHHSKQVGMDQLTSRQT